MAEQSEESEQSTASMLQQVRELLGDKQYGSSASSLPQLDRSVQDLCSAYRQQTRDLQSLESRLHDLHAAAPTAVVAADGKVRPHELHSRVQQLTAERDLLAQQLADSSTQSQQMAADHASATQQLAALHVQVQHLQAEREALELLKRSTIADLRRQNDELRRSMTASPLAAAAAVAPSPTASVVGDHSPGAPSTPGFSTSAFPSAAAFAAGSSVVEANSWQAEFESLVSQLKLDRADLRDQVRHLSEAKGELEGRLAELTTQASRQGQLIVEYERQMDELQTQAARSSAVAGAAVAAAAAAGPKASAGLDGGSETEQLRERVRDLEAQLAELQEAETVIKEWSDYASSLAADKAQLEARVRHLEAQVGETSSAAPQSSLRSGGAAAAVAAVAAATAAADRAEAEGATPEEVAGLRAEIHRLGVSLAGLRQQLSEAGAHSVGSGIVDDTAASAPRGAQQGVAAARAHSGDEDGGCGYTTPWDIRVEQLLALNAALEATVAGLQMSLAAATRQLEANEADAVAQMQLELTQALQAKAQLEATVAVLEADLQQRPLLSSSSRSAAGAPGRPASGVPSGDEPTAAPVPSSRSVPLATALSGRKSLELPPGNINVPGQVLSPQPSGTASQQPGPRLGGVAAGGFEPAELQAEVEQLQGDRAMLTATVAGLRSEVSRLQEDKGDADRAIERLSSEMQEMAEALDAAGEENERLSLELLELRAQAEQWEEQQQQQGATGTSTSGIAHISGRAADASEARAFEGRLAALRAATLELLELLHAGGSRELVDDDDLQQALHAAKDQVVHLQQRAHHVSGPLTPNDSGHIPRRGSSSSAAGAAALAAADPQQQQLVRAIARVEQLEALLEDAEIENQNLTEQLEEYLTGGGAVRSAGSAAGESQSTYSNATPAAGGGAAAGAAAAYSYGDNTSLALSALEQRLALAEARRDEVSAALDEAARGNRRLTLDVRELQGQCSSLQRANEQLQAVTTAAVQRFADVCKVDPEAVLGPELAAQVSGRGRAGGRGRASTDEDEELSDRKTVREKAAQQRDLAKAQASVADLQAANRKLEGICADLEEKAQSHQQSVDRLQRELQDASATIQGLQRRLEEEAGGGQGAAAAAAGSAALQAKVSQLESKCARLAKDKAALEQQLEEERLAREELEDTVKDRLERNGDDDAAEAVEAFENKYKRLKEKYKVLEESSQDELDDLSDQLAAAQAQVSDLQRHVKQLQSTQNTVGARAAGPAASTEELASLRAENERVVSQLVATTMELAEVAEAEITLRRDLARAKEVNMKLAQKMTTLEAQAVQAVAPKSAAKK